MFKGSPRLPTFAVPRHYNAEIQPDLIACKFDGKLAVTVEIIEATSHLVLNAADLMIPSSSVWLRCNETRQVLWPSSVEIDKEDELLVLTFAQNLPMGEALLSMDFHGELNDSMKGLYRSSYVKDGVSHFMAVTQFEPADARRCFPCWDEPALKATFKITIQAPIDRVVLSNMPVEAEEIIGNEKRVIFQVSPIMSTYLVAIVVGELEYVESETSSGNKVRVYCEIGRSEQGKFALDIATKTLPFYERYFGTSYPLPKLDMVAIPDFAAGAMENYGLVTYRESALLYDEKSSAASNKQRIAIVVAHELAHQWFGNLVTMEWWTHLWLNEGFATWVSYLAVDYLFPDWNIWTQFINQTVTAFKLDGLVESHPIEVEVGHAKEIDEIFDAISYNKGASIIRMLQTYLGPDVFQKGLVSYIKKYAYKNAYTEDLWSSLSEESKEPVKELMDSWTKQQGYPVLAVTLKGSSLQIEQTQYLSSGAPGNGEWIVPVTVCSGSYSSVLRHLVRGKVYNIDLPAAANEDSGHSDGVSNERSSTNWLKLNVNQASFYRVQYDEELAGRLHSAITSGSLNATDRFGILDDTFALCVARKQTMTMLLTLLDAFREETDHTVLQRLINVASSALHIIMDAIPEAAPYMKKFICNLLQSAAGKLGWDVKDGESHLDTMLRGNVLVALINCGHEDVIAEAMNRFECYLKDRDTSLLPADIRSATFHAVMQKTTSLDRKPYDDLLELYRQSTLSQEKTRILENLAATPDPALVKEALDFSITSEVRSQDTFYVFSGISREGRDAAWVWLKEHWDFVSKKWGGFLITRFITSTASQFSDNEKANEVESFFAVHGDPSIKRSVSQSVESVRIAALWVEKIRTENGLMETIKDLSSRKCLL
ncbi:hypothetical protein KP509_09G084800 [Ceratopteris richardii]|nr:hypothetical protein KP509_09G084800 [Ceratopteris richardii]KAH7430124.1 hypothetical protein KP509_09G084800 [Ceratopteris richardii]KAH7430125.1 hypothetical protein KP509_09G084800 [Ceratopteris richardii]KAH7430126.1 hypothetical protein KP509_09G084800 [Ceratopteris richardii]